MTQLEHHLSASTPQRRLILGRPQTADGLYLSQKLLARGPVAREVIEDICKILQTEIHHHATEQPRTREQCGYLVGWHDALHSLRDMAASIHDDPSQRIFLSRVEKRDNTGVPTVPSFPDNVSLQEAMSVVLWRGRHFMTVDEENAARLDGLRPRPSPFRPDRANHHADNAPNKPSTAGNFSTSPPPKLSNVNITLLSDDLPKEHLPASAPDGSLLYASTTLRDIETSKLLLKYEQQARLSEHKIIAELAQISLMRQAIFQDRFFGNTPTMDWENARDGDVRKFGPELNYPCVGEAQQHRAVVQVKDAFEEWRSEEVKVQAAGQQGEGLVGKPRQSVVPTLSGTGPSQPVAKGKTGGLFGSSPQPPAQNSTGGLFGTHQPVSRGNTGGLFGGRSQPSAPTAAGSSGLPAPPLFPKKAIRPFGRFEMPPEPPAPNKTRGLFGSSPQPSAQNNPGSFRRSSDAMTKQKIRALLRSPESSETRNTRSVLDSSRPPTQNRSGRGVSGKTPPPRRSNLFDSMPGKRAFSPLNYRPPLLSSATGHGNRNKTTMATDEANGSKKPSPFSGQMGTTAGEKPRDNVVRSVTEGRESVINPTAVKPPVAESNNPFTNVDSSKPILLSPMASTWYDYFDADDIFYPEELPYFDEHGDMKFRGIGCGDIRTQRLQDDQHSVAPNLVNVAAPPQPPNNNTSTFCFPDNSEDEL